MSTCDRCEAVWRRLCCNVVQYDLFRRILRHHANAVVPGFLLEDNNLHAVAGGRRNGYYYPVHISIEIQHDLFSH